MRQTTRDIKSTVVEKSSSRVYCRSAFVSNSSSRVARLSANCMVPRAMMEIGLSWTKRSKIVPSIIGFASVLFPDCHEGENLQRTPEGNTFKGLDSNPVVGADRIGILSHGRLAQLGCGRRLDAAADVGG